MQDRSLFFELLSVALLLSAGCALVMLDLPGWGLVVIAAILAILSLMLRTLKPEEPEPVPVKITAHNRPYR
ncbi:hypothetical protein [Amphritea sp. HPY]|uniref:hypothetical protein n=1 Tax=Amphritea sp. HPY TaxID=3421652 RepID=UPI003D7E5658